MGRSFLLLGLIAGLSVGCVPAEEANKTRSAEDGTSPIRTVSQEEVLQWINMGTAPLILDVRTEGEYKQGHVPGAVLIPHTALSTRLAEIEQHKAQGVVVYCEVGARASHASRLLTEAGFKNVGHLEGDMSAWRANNLPIEQE